MATRTIYICDSCKQEKKTNKVFASHFANFGSEDSICLNTTGGTIDLCDSCSLQISASIGRAVAEIRDDLRGEKAAPPDSNDNEARRLALDMLDVFRGADVIEHAWLATRSDIKRALISRATVLAATHLDSACFGGSEDA